MSFCYTVYMPQEKEFKWDASARGAFACFVRVLRETVSEISASQDLSITDRYLDNARGDLSSQKIALRIRRQGCRYEATFKTRTALKNGLACRKEVTKPLPNVRSFAAALRALENLQSWEGMALNGLRVRFTLRNRRRIYRVRYGAVQCEAALDRYVIEAAGKRLARREIELELKSGPEKDFMCLLRTLSEKSTLSPVRISKVACAENLLRL